MRRFYKLHMINGQTFESKSQEVSQRELQEVRALVKDVLEGPTKTGGYFEFATDTGWIIVPRWQLVGFEILDVQPVGEEVT